jgi:hypothetical protein
MNDESPRNLSRLIPSIGFAVKSTFLLPLQILILFLSAGTLTWFEGWLYALVVYPSALLSMTIVGWTNDELLGAKMEFPQDQQAWDKTLLRLNIPLMFAIPILAGLDHRWGGQEIWRLS